MTDRDPHNAAQAASLIMRHARGEITSYSLCMQLLNEGVLKINDTFKAAPKSAVLITLASGQIIIVDETGEVILANGDSGNAADVARRLIQEFEGVTARKDWEAWAEEVVRTLRRLLP